ncbi:hypothetical protein PUN28_002537 [Cardiocondyla obscurior]|uniref:Chitin-binding type-2 domain-containing protein n=1 Tax=Cardiocondyla obscurior TaxID=286306 RepID=A0AAW2GV05_9HYME
MKGIYVIFIAFAVCWIQIIAEEQLIQEKEIYENNIPTKCPPFEIFASNIAHETDCTKFYKCHYGRRYIMTCPPSGDSFEQLHFNRREQVCDWHWRAGCAYCPLKNKNGSWPRSKISHETDNCRYYYDCINGDKHLRSCPPHTCFSRTCQACVVNRAGGNCD